MFTEIFSRAVPLLKDTESAHLIDDWKNLNRYVLQKEIRIAVLGPFNQGKSTLLNALLGDKHLPIDIVPTTGTAIFIRYGTELKTKISLQNGQSFSGKGCDLLHRFAVLDKKRGAPEGIKSIVVSCPHPILQGDVTLIDLPGTNDAAELENLVKQELVFADVIIQVLNARQLFTLEEEIKLQNWIIESGVQTVYFVVNFSNLLETNDQKAVLNRAGTVFESISSKLSPKSGLYRVDALPALRAQLDGNVKGLKQSGLTEFATDLRILTDEILSDKNAYRSRRINEFAGKVLTALVNHNASQSNLLNRIRQERKDKDSLQGQKSVAFQKKLSQLFSVLRKEFNQNNLRKNQKPFYLAALRSNTAATWQENSFKPWLESKLTLIDAQMNEMSLFTKKPFSLSISLPSAPIINLPAKPEVVTSTNNGGGAVGGGVTGAIIGTALFPGVGTLIGAALGGWLGNSVNNSIVEDIEKEKATALAEYNRQMQIAYEAACEAYFRDFHKNAISVLSETENSWNNLLRFVPTPVSTLEIHLEEQIKETNNIIANLKNKFSTARKNQM